MTKHNENETPRERALRQLTALLAMAESTTSEAEADAFAEKAAELMTLYNIEAIDLGPSSPDDYVQEEYRVKSIDAWLRRLLQAVSSTNFCRTVVYTRRHRGPAGYAKTIFIVGEKVNITATKMVFEYLEAALRRLGREAHDTELLKDYGYIPKPLSRRLLNERRRYVDSFYDGAITVLRARLMEQRRKLEEGQLTRENGTPVTADQGRALVVVKDQAVKDALKRFHPESFDKKASAPRSNRDEKPGYWHGVDAGANIGLDPQVGGATPRESLKAGN